MRYTIRKILFYYGEHMSKYTGFTEAHKRGNDKYLREKVDSITVRVPKGTRDKIQRQADDKHISVNAWMNEAVREKLERNMPESL